MKCMPREHASAVSTVVTMRRLIREMARVAGAGGTVRARTCAAARGDS
jgi:hypothetical protein